VLGAWGKAVARSATKAPFLCVLTGCLSMAPKYERPASPVPANLPGAEGSAAPIALDAFVREPRLKQVLARVVAQNRSLRRTVLDIETARAQYHLQRSQLFPTINAQVGMTETRQFFGIPGAPPTVDLTTFSAGIGTTAWEVDLFHRVGDLSDARMQQYYAAIETAKAERITLVAEAASAWVTLAADRSRLQIANETMATAKKGMDLTEQLVGGGTSNRGDFWQASTIFQGARADVALLTSQIAQDRNALELLAGGPIEDALLPDALPTDLDWFADVPVGLSSAVLLERPDVLSVEHQLIAANANIGAARASFFPTLQLTASGGIISAALSALFTGPTAVWTFAPSIVAPLFRGGAGTANLDLAKAQKQSLIATYELTIQTAFRETADALATRATIQEQLAAQNDLVTANDKAFQLAQARYQVGIESFLATLVFERALYGAKNSLIATQQLALGNRIQLYRVLAR
jgi:multidrug efflux system outer membrane protein